MTIEIVDFPMKNGGSFHSYVNVYQRVNFTQLREPLLVTRPGGDDTLGTYIKRRGFSPWCPVRNMIFLNGGFSTSKLVFFATWDPRNLILTTWNYGGWASEILHQLVDGFSMFILLFIGLTIQGDAGFLPFTVPPVNMD